MYFARNGNKIDFDLLYIDIMSTTLEWDPIISMMEPCVCNEVRMAARRQQPLWASCGNTINVSKHSTIVPQATDTVLISTSFLCTQPTSTVKYLFCYHTAFEALQSVAFAGSEDNSLLTRQFRAKTEAKTDHEVKNAHARIILNSSLPLPANRFKIELKTSNRYIPKAIALNYKLQELII